MAVAQTIGAHVVSPEAVTITVTIAALVGADAWSVLTWRLGIPSSSPHALIGGLLGAVLVSTRFDLTVLEPSGLLTIVVGLFPAPVAGLMAAYLLMACIRFLLRSAKPYVNWFFKRGQFVTTLGLALSHGANDAPKTMGIIVMGLVARWWKA